MSTGERTENVGSSVERGHLPLAIMQNTEEDTSFPRVSLCPLW